MVINMKALISTIEPRKTGFRVAQVEPDNKTFPVADELFWVTCADDVVADEFWYDPSDQDIKPFPQPEPEPEPEPEA
jgi:hypothetical protein